MDDQVLDCERKDSIDSFDAIQPQSVRMEVEMDAEQQQQPESSPPQEGVSTELQSKLTSENKRLREFLRSYMYEVTALKRKVKNLES